MRHETGQHCNFLPAFVLALLGLPAPKAWCLEKRSDAKKSRMQIKTKTNANRNGKVLTSSCAASVAQCSATSSVQTDATDHFTGRCTHFFVYKRLSACKEVYECTHGGASEYACELPCIHGSAFARPSEFTCA